MPPSSSDCAKDVRSPINCTAPNVFVSKYREERAKKFLDDADSMGKLSIKDSRELISIRPSKSNACSAPELEVSGADETQPASHAAHTLIAAAQTTLSAKAMRASRCCRWKRAMQDEHATGRGERGQNQTALSLRLL